MEAMNGMGGLIPLWILGAGFLAGIVELMRTPTPRRRSDSQQRPSASDPTVPHTGAYQRGRALS